MIIWSEFVLIEYRKIQLYLIFNSSVVQRFYVRPALMQYIKFSV